MKFQALPLFIATFILSLLFSGCASMGPPDTTKLHRWDLKTGAGEEAVRGKKLVVHYTGWLFDAAKGDYKGRLFDTSRTRGQPLTVVLGQSRIIKGWEEGLIGMKPGGQRTLIIPSEMAYGPNSIGLIPANSVLVFDIELLDVK